MDDLHHLAIQESDSTCLVVSDRFRQAPHICCASKGKIECKVFLLIFHFHLVRWRRHLDLQINLLCVSSCIFYCFLHLLLSEVSAGLNIAKTIVLDILLALTMIESKAILAAWARERHIFLAEGTTSILGLVFTVVDHHPFGPITNCWNFFIEDDFIFLIAITLLLPLLDNSDVLGEDHF